jgi:hypothetical protein
MRNFNIMGKRREKSKEEGRNCRKWEKRRNTEMEKTQRTPQKTVSSEKQKY